MSKAGDDIHVVRSVSEEDLAAYPFGVLQLNLDGVVDQYHPQKTIRPEVKPKNVIGKNLFTEIMKDIEPVRDFLPRFQAGVKNHDLDATIKLIFAFPKPRLIVITLHHDDDRNCAWVVVADDREHLQT